MAKSSVYVLFGSKEELQLATADAAREQFVTEVVIPALSAAETVVLLVEGLVCVKFSVVAGPSDRGRARLSWGTWRATTAALRRLATGSGRDSERSLTTAHTIYAETPLITSELISDASSTAMPQSVRRDLA